MFAFSSVIVYGFYGMKGFGYLFGDNPRAEKVYQAVFVSFSLVGSALALGPVVLFGDSLYFVMGIFNIIGLYFLANVIRREFADYWRNLKAGEIQPVGRARAKSAAVPTERS